MSSIRTRSIVSTAFGVLFIVSAVMGIIADREPTIKFIGEYWPKTLTGTWPVVIISLICVLAIASIWLVPSWIERKKRSVVGTIDAETNEQAGSLSERIENLAADATKLTNRRGVIHWKSRLEGLLKIAVDDRERRRIMRPFDGVKKMSRSERKRAVAACRESILALAIKVSEQRSTPVLEIDHKPHLDRLSRPGGRHLDVAVRIYNQSDNPTDVTLKIVRVVAVGNDKEQRQPAYNRIRHMDIGCIRLEEIEKKCTPNEPIQSEFTLNPFPDDKQLVVCSAGTESIQLFTEGEWNIESFGDEGWYAFHYNTYVELNGEWRIELKASAKNGAIGTASLSILPPEDENRMPRIRFSKK